MSGPRMRFSEVREEAARNLRSGTSRATLLVLLVGALVSALVLLDMRAMTQVVAAAERFRQSGGSITVLVAEGSIDGRVCDALAAFDGVRAAGALSKRGAPLAVAGVPQNPLTFFESTPGFTRMLPDSTGQQAPGLLLPDTVAHTLGLGIGDRIFTADGESVLGGTYAYPDDGRPRGMGYAAIAPGQPGRLFDECWVDAYPVTRATIDRLYTAISADSTLDDSGPAVVQHNTSLGTATEPAAAFSARMTAAFPLVGFLLGLLLGGLSVLTRRLEIAAALHAGVRRADQTSILLLETIAWAAVGSGVAVPVIAILAQQLAAQDHLIVVLTALKTPTMSAAGLMLGTLLATLTIRERRLFAYFKGR